MNKRKRLHQQSVNTRPKPATVSTGKRSKVMHQELCRFPTKTQLCALKTEICKHFIRFIKSCVVMVLFNISQSLWNWAHVHKPDVHFQLAINWRRHSWLPHVPIRMKSESPSFHFRKIKSYFIHSTHIKICVHIYLFYNPDSRKVGTLKSKWNPFWNIPYILHYKNNFTLVQQRYCTTPRLPPRSSDLHHCSCVGG